MGWFGKKQAVPVIQPTAAPSQNLYGPGSSFQKDLIKELGLEDLAEDKKEELLRRTREVIEGNIQLRILDELNEKQKERFDALLAEKNPEKNFAFLNSVLPLEQIVKEEIAKYKAEIIARMRAVTGSK